MNNKTPLVSIIIPIYNTEDYLDKCIESIVFQTFQNIEIILVNDGSRDSSSQICDKWANKDLRVHVIHKKNEGVTIARKTGVLHAQGEWVCFVDSDDCLPKDAILSMANYIRDDIDMIHGKVESAGNKSPKFKHFGEKHTTQFLKILLSRREYWAPFAQLIRKSLFDEFTFDIPQKITVGEDFIMNLRLAQKYRKVVLIPQIVYLYILRSNSAMSSLSKLDKEYRALYTNTFKQSISSEYRKTLKKDVVYFLLKRYLRRNFKKLKNTIKK